MVLLVDALYSFVQVHAHCQERNGGNGSLFDMEDLPDKGNAKQENLCSTSECFSRSTFPQCEPARISSTSSISNQDAECSSLSGYRDAGAAVGMNAEIFNVPFSSKAFSSHLTEFSKIHCKSITHSSIHVSSHDEVNHIGDSTQENIEKNSALPESGPSETSVAAGAADHSQTSGYEKTEEKGERSSLQTDTYSSQQYPSHSQPSRNSSIPTQQHQSSNASGFFVTPSIDSDSDTDEYTEAEYKPVIEKLELKNQQKCVADDKQEERAPNNDENVVKRLTRGARRSARQEVVVKEEPESGQSAGSDCDPSSYGKGYPTRKKVSKRILPRRQKRLRVTQSSLEYNEDSDDIEPKKSHPERKTRSANKSASDLKDNEPKTKANRPTPVKHSKARSQSSSKGPSNKTCPECHKTFSRADSLTVHMRVHTGDRPFKCQECGATYKVSSHLRNHIRSKHSDVKAFKCSKCEKAFSTSNAKRRHEKTCGTDLSQRVKHECSRCLKRFVTEDGYERHKNQNTCNARDTNVDINDDNESIDTAGEITGEWEGETHTCSDCHKVFADASSLNTHKTFLCGKTPGAGHYACSQCQKEFPKWNHFIAHCRQHTDDKPYICSHCDSRFFDKPSLRKHISRHKEKTVVKCSLCDKEFTAKRTLSMHIMRVHCGMKPYKCNECDNDFASAKLLSTHIRRVHRKEKRFKCQICTKAFFDAQAWMKHTILHAENRPPRIRGPVHKYPCNLCGKSFNMRLMRMHVEEDHPGVALSEAVTKTMVTCKLCKKEFSDPSSLKMHMIRHSGRKDFKCDKCDMYFITPAAMQLHQRKHSSDRPYACEECGQTFRWRASLRDHKMHLHNPNLDPPDANGRRFGCRECGQRFKRSNTLRTHMIRHRSVMPCICSECGKGFTDNTRLRIHMSCHNSGSDRPFICEICGAGFYYSFLLKRHIQSRHHPSPWLCNLCGRSLCSKDALKRHIAHHANSPDGSVHVGGNRGRPRKIRDPEEGSSPKEDAGPIMKGKRGRKSKKSLEVMKQIEDEAENQKVLQGEDRNVKEPNNYSSQARETVESTNLMDSTISREAINSTNMMEPTDIWENKNALNPGNIRNYQLSTATRNETEPMHFIDPRNTVEHRNAMESMKRMESANTVDPRDIQKSSSDATQFRNTIELPNVIGTSLVEPGNIAEPRNAVEGRSSLMEPQNLVHVESQSVMEPRNVVQFRNITEAHHMIDPGNIMEYRNNLLMEPRSTLESRNLIKPRDMMEFRNSLQFRSMIGTGNNNDTEFMNMREPRGELESRRITENVNAAEPRIIADSSLNATEPRSLTDSTNLAGESSGSNISMVDCNGIGNGLDPRTAANDPRPVFDPQSISNPAEPARAAVEPRMMSVDPRVPVDPRNPAQPVAVGNGRESTEGGTFVELSRVGDVMQVNNGHLFAPGHNLTFPYPPAAHYMLSPGVLWPKTEER